MKITVNERAAPRSVVALVGAGTLYFPPFAASTHGYYINPFNEVCRAQNSWKELLALPDMIKVYEGDGITLTF